MNANDVIELIKLFKQHGIEIIIDGGWAVDALFGKQTRLHADLDIAVEHKFVSQIREILEARGYRDVPRDDTRDCNFVLGDEQGRQIDIHTFTFDENGKLIFGIEYPFDSLNGSAEINNYPVRCITPEWLVKFHTGYQVDENDYHDVKLLCEKFNLEIPTEYEEFIARDKKL
ncbi:MAG: Lincosamide resistance protein [Chloroflexi bacterium OLB14]|nr:MAG: Lincosamide resistance protein [Chloroflexi bacterium OLB14]